MWDEFLKSNVTGPYLRKSDGRKYMCVRAPGERHGSTMSYPKWLAMHILGRLLDDDETVDHIDRDKSNDDPSNLRVVSKRKHVMEDAQRAESVTISCILCGKQAQKKARHLRHNSKLGRAGPFCGRSCAGTYSRGLQAGTTPRADVQPSPKSILTFREKDVPYESTLAYPNRQRSSA
jgi:hypothetical protein